MNSQTITPGFVFYYVDNFKIKEYTYMGLMQHKNPKIMMQPNWYHVVILNGKPKRVLQSALNAMLSDELFTYSQAVEFLKKQCRHFIDDLDNSKV